MKFKKNKGGTVALARAKINIYIHGTAGHLYSLSLTHSFQMTNILSQQTTHTLFLARPPFQNNILLYVVGMDEFDTKDIKSQVFVEPKTNNVIIKITGFPSSSFAQMYLAWLMNFIGFEIGDPDNFTQSTLH